MNRKQFILILLALTLVGGAGLVLLHRSRQAWSVREARTGGKVLPNFRPNDVASIHIKGPMEFNLVHKDNSWCVPERGDYRANYDQIKDLLVNARDLKVVQSETIGPSQLARVCLEEPGRGQTGGLLVEFKDAQGRGLGSLVLGKKHDRQQNENEPLGLHGFFDGRWLLVPAEPHNALLVADELGCAAPGPGAWLAQDFFRIENIRFISLRSPNSTNSWELSRSGDSGPWSLAGLKPGEALNPGAAADVAEILAFPRFLDVAPKNDASLATMGPPTVVLVMTEYFAYTIKVGAKGPDGNYPLTVSVTGEIPAERVAGNDETPEQRQKLDQEFQGKRTKLQEKLTREQALASWIYQVDRWVEMVIRDRPQLLQQGSTAITQSAQR